MGEAFIRTHNCNRAQRSISTAITDAEWDHAETDMEIPVGVNIDLGLDVAFKWDTTAFVPLWRTESFSLLGQASILVPPRDGTMLHPDEIKAAFTEIVERNPVSTLIMDISKAEDLAAWFEAQGVTVFEWAVGNKQKVSDYETFMAGLRNGQLKHTGDPGLRSHVLNAIARKLPLGDYRFDRPLSSRRAPGQQDRRVIDALDAAASVYQFSTREQQVVRSVYEDRDLLIA